MNNKGLLIVIGLAIVFTAAIKFQLLPQFDSAKVAEEVKRTNSSSVLKHKDGIEKEYFSNGNVRSEIPYFIIPTET